MRWLFLIAAVLIAALLTACRPRSVGWDVGDEPPVGTQPGDYATVLFVTALDDLLSCPLQDVLVALRSAQRAGDASSSMTVLLVTRNAGDSLALSRALRRERVEPHIVPIPFGEARWIVDLTAIPAVYLLEGERIVRAWERVDRTVPAIQRNEIVDAVAHIGKGE